MFRTGGIGEWGAPGDGSGAAWLEAQRLIARAGWRNENHATSLAALQNEVAGYETVNAETPITHLRWVTSHIPFATPQLLDGRRAWLHIYYATTGVNALGQLINDGQQITRTEALRL